MADITGNTCDVITLFPLEVECNITNATTNLTNDGSINLLINGGTAPYVISWNGGQIGTTLNNLSAGTYSATVIDYYGDFTATTECEVGFDTFKLSKLTECDNLSNIIYLTNTGFDTDLVYRFNEINACYEYVEDVLYTAQTYSALTISNIYENGCNECNPPQPSPPAQISMCLSNGVDTQYTFTYSGTDVNGNYVWTSGSMVLSYDTSGYWSITPWAVGGSMRLYQSPVSTYPLGLWSNFGVDSRVIWEMTAGACGALPLSLSALVSDANCVGENGSVVLTATNGVPNYFYSIQSYSTQQQSGVFINVPPGTYTGVVQDSDNPPNLAITQFTIGAGSISTNYSFFITQIGSTTTTPNNVNDSITTTHSYQISVNPPLPVGVSFSTDIRIFNFTEKSGKQPNTNSTTFSNLITITKNGVTVLPTSNTSPINTNGVPCGVYPSPQTTYNTYVDDVVFTTNDYVTVNITQTVDLNTLGDDCNCLTKGRYYTFVEVLPQGLTGGTCNTYNQRPIQTQNVETVRQGCQASAQCKTYQLLNNSGANAIFSYTDCNGDSQVRTLTPQTNVYICSLTTPVVTFGLGQVNLISNTCT
jgi:hypothetical protein